MTQTYRIVFRGEILAGHEPAGVRQRIATTFKIDLDKLDEKLFSDRPVVLAKGLTSQQAQMEAFYESIGVKH